jgi:hypothetical protein
LLLLRVLSANEFSLIPTKKADFGSSTETHWMTHTTFPLKG